MNYKYYSESYLGQINKYKSTNKPLSILSRIITLKKNFSVAGLHSS